MKSRLRPALAALILANTYSVLGLSPALPQGIITIASDQNSTAEAEVAAALYAASATQEAAQRLADARIRELMREIDGLRATAERAAASGAASLQAARLDLARAEERFVEQLAARDRAYAQEIAVFRAAVEDIASTPEGLAALALFNTGRQIEALASLDDLVAARAQARQMRTDIETAAEKRRIATLALDARKQGLLTTLDLIARYEEVTSLDPGMHWDWVELGRLYMAAGRFTEAQRAAESAIQLSKTEMQRSVALDELGDALEQKGDLQQALIAYQQSKEIREGCVSSARLDDGFLEALAVSHSKLGSVLRAQGKRDEAVLAYRESFEIAKYLSNEDPSIIQRQSNLIIAHRQLGSALAAQGNTLSAREHFDESLALAEKLVSIAPKNTVWKRHQMHSHGEIGRVFSIVGDLQEAQDSWQAALQISEALVTSDPSNDLFIRDLYTNLFELGKLSQEKGDLNHAIETYERCVEIIESRLSDQPHNMHWRREFSKLLRTVGDVLLEDDDLQGALTAYAYSLILIEDLAASDPSNARWQLDLLMSNLMMAEITGEHSFKVAALQVARNMEAQGMLPLSEKWVLRDLDAIVSDR